MADHYCPRIVALDVWMALGFDSREFDAYVDENGMADTWSKMLDVVRGIDKPVCAKPTGDNDWCLFTERHGGPCYGADDVGRPNDLLVKFHAGGDRG